MAVLNYCFKIGDLNLGVGDFCSISRDIELGYFYDYENLGFVTHVVDGYATISTRGFFSTGTYACDEFVVGNYLWLRGGLLTNRNVDDSLAIGRVTRFKNRVLEFYLGF